MRIPKISVSKIKAIETSTQQRLQQDAQQAASARLQEEQAEKKKATKIARNRTALFLENLQSALEEKAAQNGYATLSVDVYETNLPGAGFEKEAEKRDVYWVAYREALNNVVEKLKEQGLTARIRVTSVGHNPDEGGYPDSTTLTMTLFIATRDDID